MLRSGLALQGQIQVVEEGIPRKKQPGRGNQNESGVRRAFTHMAARPGMVKHGGVRRVPHRRAWVSEPKRVKGMSKHKDPRAGCGNPGRGEAVDRVGWGKACPA